MSVEHTGGDIAAGEVHVWADAEVTPGEHVCDYDHDPDAPCPGALTEKEDEE